MQFHHYKKALFRKINVWLYFTLRIRESIRYFANRVVMTYSIAPVES